MGKFLIMVLLLMVLAANCGWVMGNVIIRNAEQESTTLNDSTTKRSSTTEEPHTAGEILASLRRVMRDTNIVTKSIQAYIVPARDEHNSEFVAKRDKRLQFITAGFTGSAGEAVITTDKAAFWTDGRYHLQAEGQLDKEYWTIMKSGQLDVPTKEEWLSSVLPPNSRVGIDLFLISYMEFDKMAKKLKGYGHELVGITDNLVDMIWTDRPDFMPGEIYPHDFQFTGQAVVDKITSLREDIGKQGANVIVISVLDEIAWLLNLRGKDQEDTPVFFSYLIVTPKSIVLYAALNRVTPHIISHLEEEGVDVVAKPYDKAILMQDIAGLVCKMDNKFIVSSETNAAIYKKIPELRSIEVISPVALMKCTKNPVEAEGMRQAHRRDGVALVRYLHWLEKNVDYGNVTEISGAEVLLKLRENQEYNMGKSFPSISAVGANSAIVHYMPTSDSNRLITRDELYLIDSGGQYLDGTTDVTRTIHLGTPTDFQKECYTRVLKGQLAVGAAIFPKHASGTFFDSIARRPLWEIGLDYGHGTGHGIGSFLGVHEYPPRLLSSATLSATPGALENMFTSNEPGYYQDGEFGIRIEDIVQVIPADVAHNFGGRGAFAYFTVTLAPHQLKMMDVSLLTAKEIRLIDDYHHRVREEIGGLLKEQRHLDVYEWLKAQTINVSIYHGI